MPRYLVTSRRSNTPVESRPSALDAVQHQPGVEVVVASPNMVTIETSPDVADQLARKLEKHFFVEQEVRRNLLE
jgi:hypothetical protein